ncbi:MAG: ATP synthase subunit I [Desulfobacteraceae bacterium]|nr:ATP synthase subunit I [Desulfobacteraceae bacterium]
MMTAINEDNLFSVIIKGSLGLLAVLALGAFVLFSCQAALGVLAGGVIAIVNFLWMRNVLQRILGLLPVNAQRYALMRYIARMTVTGCALYFVLTSGWFSLAGTLAGLSIIVVNIISLSLYRAIHTGG